MLSWRLPLFDPSEVGRPDQILRAGRSYIPVEQKPTVRRLYPSHAMQVAAQCILVQEVYGVRPPYGVVVLSGGRAEHVAFTPQLERDVHEAMREMRRILTAGNDPGPRWVVSKCYTLWIRRRLLESGDAQLTRFDIRCALVSDALTRSGDAIRMRSAAHAVRPSLAAIQSVVPRPQKGSATTSPGKLNKVMQRRGNSSGNGAAQNAS